MPHSREVDKYCFYLFRRARENGGMLSKLATEKRLLRKELLSRFATGKFFYNPKGDYVPVGFEKINGARA